MDVLVLDLVVCIDLDDVAATNTTLLACSILTLQTIDGLAFKLLALCQAPGWAVKQQRSQAIGSVSLSLSLSLSLSRRQTQTLLAVMNLTRLNAILIQAGDLGRLHCDGKQWLYIARE